MEEKERERLDRELDMLNKLNEGTGNASEPAGGAPSDTSEALKVLQTLQNEAESLGLDPANIAETSYRGRGRGGVYRARGRGGWPRAWGGGVQRSYKLDNRTTKVLVKGVPEATREALRSYFEQFGEVEGVNFMDDVKSAVVQFKNRKDAEQALVRGTNIPEVGAVQLTWHNEAIPVTSATESEAGAGEVPGTLEGQSETASKAVGVRGAEFDEDDDDEERERSWKR